jgi:NADH-quinone oxidoreductase subunit N
LLPLAQAAQAPLDLPEVAWRAIAPELALLAAGVVTILWVAFLPRQRGPVVFLTFAGLVAAAVFTAWNWDLEQVAFEGAFAADGITRYARVVLLAAGALATLLIAADQDEDRRVPPEVLPLLLFALTGMTLLAAASDLLVAFIALEILSLSLYVMVGATGRRRAREASMKYFLLGAFSSAFLIYGIALVYGATGTTALGGIADAVADATVDTRLLLAGTALIAVGFCFKVAAVPFHMWTPDVYQGAPSSITAFMAAATKTAAFAVFLRVFVGGLGGLATSWRPVIAAVAAITMLGGAVLAVIQTDVKRMLAYSSVNHAGYVLIGLAAASQEGISASLFYLLAYALMVMGAFAVVQYAERGQLVGADDPENGGTALDRWRGFGRRHPLAGGLLALFLFSLAGIPPALSGFWAKYFVFQAGVDAGLAWLVVIGVVSSVIAAFLYLRIVVVTFLTEPTAEQVKAAGDLGARGRLTSPALDFALVAAGALTVALGFAPQALVTAAESAGRILG